MELTEVFELVALAALAMLSVGLWTLRVAVTARGNALLGATLAAMEATVFIVAVSRLLSDIDSPARVAAYGAGVAVGTLVGMRLDTLVNPRIVRVDIVSPGSGLVDALVREHIPHTVSHGLGASGPVVIVSVAVLQRELGRVTKLARSTDPRAFWTVATLTGMSGAGRQRRPSARVRAQFGSVDHRPGVDQNRPFETVERLNKRLEETVERPVVTTIR